MNIELNPKITPRTEKHDESLSASREIKKEINKNNFEKNELYQKIQFEMTQVVIRTEDKDKEGSLLAPNRKKSNLPEKEWRMVRTPSFKKWFGDWEKKYNKEDLENWIKFQYLKSLEEDTLFYLQEKVETLKQERIRSKNLYLKNPAYSEDEKKEEDLEAHYGDLIKHYNDRRIALLHEISRLQAEIVNKNFNPNISDYGKILDENGEPLMVWRGTDYGPNNHGYFEIPSMVSYSGDIKIGTFLGKKSEAYTHHSNRLKEGKDSFLYSCFVNIKNIKILSKKLDWQFNEKEIKKIKKNYDGIIVKEDKGGLFKEGKLNLIDLVVFDSKNVLIEGVE